MIEIRGQYVNLFTENADKDVFLIFPEWWEVDEDGEKIIEAVDNYLERLNPSSVTKENIEYFINNNCDCYDIQVIVNNKMNTILYNAICYMVEDERTSEEICDYLGCTEKEIFEQCGYDLGGNANE